MESAGENGRQGLCLKCGGTLFDERAVDVPQEFQSSEFSVNTEAMVCRACGWFTMTDWQADKLVIAARLRLKSKLADETLEAIEDAECPHTDSLDRVEAVSVALRKLHERLLLIEQSQPSPSSQTAN